MIVLMETRSTVVHYKTDACKAGTWKGLTHHSAHNQNGYTNHNATIHH